MQICIYLLDGRIHGKLIGLFLCLTEDDGSAVAAAVHLDHVAYHGGALRPMARYGQMLQRERTHGDKWHTGAGKKNRE